MNSNDSWDDMPVGSRDDVPWNDIQSTHETMKLRPMRWHVVGSWDDEPSSHEMIHNRLTRRLFSEILPLKNPVSKGLYITSRRPSISQSYFLLFMCKQIGLREDHSADMTWWCDDDNWMTTYEIFKSWIKIGSQSWMWTITVGHGLVGHRFGKYPGNFLGNYFLISRDGL